MFSVSRIATNGVMGLVDSDKSKEKKEQRRKDTLNLIISTLVFLVILFVFKWMYSRYQESQTPVTPKSMRLRKPKVSDIVKTSNSREETTRRILQRDYNVIVWTGRIIPKAPKGKRMLEVDCYLRTNHFWVEVDGEQHTNPKVFNQSDDTFQRRVEYDRHKDDMAQYSDRILVRLPFTVDRHRIKEHIQSHLPEHFRARTWHAPMRSISRA